MNEESDFSLKTLSSVIKDYLKKVEDRTERNLLNQLKEFMNMNYVAVKIKDVKNKHFDDFLKTLSVSEKSLSSYASRLNRFKAYIGLSKEKVEKKTKNDGQLKREVSKARAETEEVRREHQKTIDNERIEHEIEIRKLHETQQKEIQKLHEIIDTFKSKGIDIKTIQSLEAKKTQLEKEVFEATNQLTPILNQLTHAKLYTNEPCPQTHNHELLANCLKCPKQTECSVIGKHWRF